MIEVPSIRLWSGPAWRLERLAGPLYSFAVTMLASAARLAARAFA
jgi:hypothetical protein